MIVSYTGYTFGNATFGTFGGFGFGSSGGALPSGPAGRFRSGGFTTRIFVAGTWTALGWARVCTLTDVVAGGD